MIRARRTEALEYATGTPLEIGGGGVETPPENPSHKRSREAASPFQ